LKHNAVTVAGAAGAFAGTTNDPFQEPSAPTAKEELVGPVVEETWTKSWLDPKRMPGAHPVPRTCTDVPGGPDVGDMLKFWTSAPATVARRIAPAVSISATATAKVRHRRVGPNGLRRASANRAKESEG